jgi:SAM-dependent methyltransferase
MNNDALRLVSKDFPFPDAPDIETSSEGYAKRFSGEIGQWFLTVQTNALLKLLGSDNSLSVLDVGGGHGQNVGALLAAGFKVTVLGSSDSCAERLKPFLNHPNFKFVVGSVVNLPFKDQSFDVVISFRLVSHLNNWSDVIYQFCRVANKKVIIDYPSKISFNALESLLFAAKKKIEGDTRHFLSFYPKDINQTFENAGFKKIGSIGQFFWPMALHRAIKSPAISAFLEGTAAIVGLTQLLGTPRIASFENQK